MGTDRDEVVRWLGSLDPRCHRRCDSYATVDIIPDSAVGANWTCPSNGRNGRCGQSGRNFPGESFRCLRRL